MKPIDKLMVCVELKQHVERVVLNQDC